MLSLGFSRLFRFCFVALWLAAAPAWAVIVYFQDAQREPVAGYLVRQDAQTVVLRVESGEGKTEEKTFPRVQVIDVLQTVSQERLAALQPANPQAYHDYAEELAEKRRDPEARDTALRLYLIAAYLDRAKLARGALLGMAGLARNGQERRKFRAIADLLDPNHNRGLLAVANANTPKGRLEDQDKKLFLDALRLLRQGHRSEALNMIERPAVKKAFAFYQHKLSAKDFEKAAKADCPHCERGFIDCERCQGTGRRRVGGRVNLCGLCNRGNLPCSHCRGDFQNPVPPAAILHQLVALELELLSDAPQPAAASQEPSWAALLGRGESDPAPALSLETLTEFDPRQCVYRNRRWESP